MANTTLSIEIDSALKERAETFYHERGLDISKAICELINRTIESDDELDGPYTEEEEELCYCPANVAAILESARELDEGKGISMTGDEFRAMAER